MAAQQGFGGGPAASDAPAPAPDDTDQDQADDQAEGSQEGTSSDQDEGDGEQASPAEQAQYEKFVLKAMELLYSPANKSVLQSIMQSMQGKNPVEGLANAAVIVVKRVYDAARQASEQIEPSVLMAAGKDVLEEIASFAKEAGIHDFSTDDVSKAFLRATDLFREQEQKNGQVDQGAAQQDLGILKNASQNGTLDQVLPGASEAAKAFGSAGKAQAQG